MKKNGRREGEKGERKQRRRKEEWEGDENGMETPTTQPGICFSLCHSLSRDPKVHAPCFIMPYILTHSREVENNIIKYVCNVCDIPIMYTPAY